MLSALRSTLEDPSGAATSSGAAREPSAPVLPHLLPAEVPPVPAYVSCIATPAANRCPECIPSSTRAPLVCPTRCDHLTLA